MQDFNYTDSKRMLRQRLFAAPPKERPSQWAERCIVFNEQEVKGPCSFQGRNYLRQPIDDNARENVREQTMVTGTGCGKTLTYIIGMMWKIKFKPCRNITVFPAAKGEGGASNFASTRLQPDIEATPDMKDLLPTVGQLRFRMNRQFIKLGGAHFGFVGGNSAAQVGSNRCSDVRIDETDKLPPKIKNEVGTGALVKNRTDGVREYQIFDTSTPTVEGGIIWPRLQRSNLHLYFLPCPRCNVHLNKPDKNFSGWFVYAWNQQYSTGLPIKVNESTIPLGYVKWSREAKSNAGEWNHSVVQQTAHVACPHCSGEIYDFKDGQIFLDDKEWMDENGMWICVKPGVPGHVGYHASSLYAPAINVESTWGGRAIDFLSAHSDGTMQAFINSKLALPEVGQASGLNKIELKSNPISQPDWITQLTADFQKNFPYIWFVARKWCAFKLLPSFDGNFKTILQEPGNESALKLADSLVDGYDAAWPAIGELMRFDSSTSVQSPLIEFLIAQKITGECLAKFFNEDGAGRALDFRAAIFKAMGLIRPPRGGDSELIATGHCGLSGDYAWDEFKEIVQDLKVGDGTSNPSRFVGIDTGYAEKFDRAVLRKCFESATEYKYYDPMSRNRPAIFYKSPIHGFCQPCPRDGWFGMKGYPINQRWNHGGIRNELNINLDDPFFGTSEARKSVVEIIEFPSGLFWLRKDDIRKGKSKIVHTVSPKVKLFPKLINIDGTTKDESTFKLADYERHMNELSFNEDKSQIIPRHGEGGAQARRHPYHLDDCEVMQMALATHHEFFETGENK